MIEKSYGIIPLNNEEGKWWSFLIHQRNGDYWGFPKGHPNEGEEKKEAAVRELFEEVGLKILSFLEIPPITSSYTFNRKGESIEKHVELFLALTTVEYRLQSEEIIDARWIPLDEAFETISFEEGKQVINQLKKRLEK